MTLSKSNLAEARRPHTKSRDGCLTCKKRRVKCDEGRPRCRNCAFGDRPCSYREPRIPSNATQTSPASPASATSSGTASWSKGHAETGGEGTVVRGPFCAQGTFSWIHMNLFHHAHSHMAELMGLCGDTKPLLDIAVTSLPTEPYVLDQLLAVSGLHLATREPHAAHAYSHEATELQTRALGSFNDLKTGVSDSNYLAAFLFATLVGIHLLHNSLAPSHRTLGEFVRQFVNYARLHRGVRAVTNTYWGKILQSDLQPLLYMSGISLDAEKNPAGDETASLRRFLESLPSPLSPAVESCLSSLKWTQWMIDLGKAHPSRPDIAYQAIIAWPLVVPDEFIAALYQHQPESLVVLAYYAATIHKYRDFWAFSEAGPALFKMIEDHVGTFWGEALAWPRMEFDQALPSPL